MGRLDEILEQRLADLDAAGLRRRLRSVRGAHGAWIELEGRRLSSFCSNNYLGLAGDERNAAALGGAARQSGLGAAASRLVAGNHLAHEDLERTLAAFHRTPAALLFNSGFQANVGVIPAFMGADDFIVSDSLNHASIIDGCRLSRAEVAIASHGDIDSFRRHLKTRRAARRNALVITESVFSMDGDLAPIADLAKVCREFDAWLMVDEAHAVGALWDGRGLAAHVGVTPDILIGTLGKAFGSFGAYVASSATVRDYLIQAARSFVFSTALPPALAAASQSAVNLVASRSGTSLRSTLAANIAHVAAGLRDLHLLVPGSGTTPIFPLLIGDESRALTFAASLFDAGIHLQAIRPPTVPRGTSRLRLTITAAHSRSQLDHLLATLHALHLPPAL